MRTMKLRKKMQNGAVILVDVDVIRREGDTYHVMDGRQERIVHASALLSVPVTRRGGGLLVSGLSPALHSLSNTR